MKDSHSIYTSRINRVTDYMRAHLDEAPTLDELAEVACFSPFHFHRIFTALTGETVNAFTNRLRLEKAAKQLKYSAESATEIALNCGFSSSSTFSRAFKKHFGISPTGFRNGATIKESKICKDLFPVNEYVIPMTVEELEKRFPVEIREFPERRVAFIRVIDAYQENRVPDAFAEMVRWAKASDLFEQGTIFGMSLDDPSVTPKKKYRYEVCLTLPEFAVVDSNGKISEMRMPASKYAVASVSGDIRIVATATEYLFDKWLIGSRFEPEHQPALEVFRDKENVLNWEHFELDLCIPVKPIQHN